MNSCSIACSRTDAHAYTQAMKIVLCIWYNYLAPGGGCEVLFSPCLSVRNTPICHLRGADWIWRIHPTMFTDMNYLSVFMVDGWIHPSSGAILWPPGIINHPICNGWFKPISLRAHVTWAAHLCSNKYRSSHFVNNHTLNQLINIQGNIST